MSGEQFSLVWNSFPRNLSSGLYTLLTDEQLVDVTLAAEGQILRAHKLILSVCSSYFRDLFKGNSCKHPIVILKDVNYRDLSAMLHFMYQGEVNIKQEDIASFLKVAETLQIKGLTTESNERLSGRSAENNEDQNYTHNIERDKVEDNISNSDIEICDEPIHTLKETQCMQNQIISLDQSSTEHSFINQNADIGDVSRSHREESISNRDYMQNTHGFYGNTEIQNNTEEPLDCTAAIDQPPKLKHEPLDYTLDVDGIQTHNTDKAIFEHELNTQRQDFVPDTQLIPYNQDSQNQSFGMDNAVTTQSNEFMYGSANCSRGRRTVKGIPTSSLPLETTLRVVSELGPTLRMERGKVIRMYSCPWCLRHFTRKENLKLHVRYIHGPLESLTCKLCGNKYKNSNSLRVHSYLYHNAKRDKHNKPLAGGAV